MQNSCFVLPYFFKKSPFALNKFFYSSHNKNKLIYIGFEQTEPILSQDIDSYMICTRIILVLKYFLDKIRLLKKFSICIAN